MDLLDLRRQANRAMRRTTVTRGIIFDLLGALGNQENQIGLLQNDADIAAQQLQAVSTERDELAEDNRRFTEENQRLEGELKELVASAESTIIELTATEEVALDEWLEKKVKPALDEIQKEATEKAEQEGAVYSLKANLPVAVCSFQLKPHHGVYSLTGKVSA